MATFVSQSDFDFNVRLSTHVVAVKAGQPASATVMVEAVKGSPRPVALTASDWKSEGLSATITPSTVVSGGVALLQITVPTGTPPGSYLFTVRGSTEGTFRTSNDTVTVVVEPEAEEKEGQDTSQNQMEPDVQGEPVVAPLPARAKRGVLARPARKVPARPVSPGQRVLLVALMFIMVGGLAYYLGTQLRSSSGGSVGSMSGTYVGTSTFCIGSVLGGSPECGTSATPQIQIDSAGDVLGPVLFGKITDGSFTGEARAGDGTTFPMTGTFSNGTLNAQYRSSSVTWTITLHRQ